MNEPLLLHVPEQHDYRNPVVELNPKRLGRWLKQLPVMNLSACLTEVVDALAPCNLQAMPGKNRIRLLELYRDMALLLFEAVEEEHLKRLPMSSEQRQSAREHTATLCTELANGYKILVREALRAESPAREPLLVPALYRAMEATALGLLHAFRTYQPAPAFAYLELHRLYALSQRAGVGDAPMLDKERLAEQSIGALYRQVLMMAVADPYRLGAGTATRLFPLLAAFAPHCRLEPFRPESREDGCFVVDRGADSAPRPAARAASEYGDEDPLLLDVRPALGEIRRWLDGAPEDRADDARVLRALVPELEQKPVRRAPRRNVQREAWVTFGIPAVHHFLARGPERLAEAIRAAGAAFHVRDLDSEAEAEHALEPWSVVNESVSGYLLASRNRWLGEPRVGDAVGVAIALADGRPRLTVAAVRWMRAAREQRVEMGVEIVPGTPRPVRCTDAEGQTLAGLFFPSAPALQLPATLVLPKGAYRPGGEIQVRTGDRTLTVYAGELITETEYFDRFDFTGGQ